MPRRPPKKWFDKMKKRIKKEYSSYGEKRINKIVAGIWHDYKPSTQKRILKTEGGGKVGRRKKGKKKGKKWGSIGAPHSAKRKRHMAKIRRKR